MRVYMNVHNKVDEYVDIEDIPINKWVYVVVSVKGEYLDIYINGELISKVGINVEVETSTGTFGGKATLVGSKNIKTPLQSSLVL